MPEYSWAQMDEWVAAMDRRLDFVVRQATNDLMKDIQIVPGINRGGSRVKGTIPRDFGVLANSLVSSLQGSTSLQPAGADSFVLVVAQMQAGDVATFGWGGPAAPYARAVHDGSGTTPGTFWVDVAAKKWPSYVAAAVLKGKAVS